MNMDDVINMIIAHEGLKLKPYRCTAGKLTIGVGRNLEDVGITEEEALYLLKNDINRILKLLPVFIKCWDELSERRKMALVDMCFNLGMKGLLSFKKMLAALEEEDYNRAADEMLDSKWASQVKTRAEELAAMMREG